MFDKFYRTPLNFSFTQIKYDTSRFFYMCIAGIIFLLAYVDDIIIFGSNHTLILILQPHLCSIFHIKDLGHLTCFFSLEVHTALHGIFLNQQKYIQDLIMLTDLSQASFVGTPLEFNVKYRKDKGDILPNLLYIGSRWVVSSISLSLISIFLLRFIRSANLCRPLVIFIW